jgi:hypothetical protein
MRLRAVLSLSLFLIPWLPVQSVLAATLTTVPMQGMMVMPMIRYDATAERLMVMVPGTIPQLVPLLVSNPSDRFDPASPWYADLDPAGRGWSFSRSYGFVMDGVSDPLPANAAIWLRKTEGDDELRVYRYSANPAAWEPIFGTAGSSNALAWNLMMFHPAFAAPPGTNGYAATFEAYLVDTTTGQEIADSATGPMHLQWTSVPDGRPDLMAGMAYLVDWDGEQTNYVLEAATSLDAASWSAVTNAPVMMDGRKAVIMRPEESGGRYFRLRRLDE